MSAATATLPSPAEIAKAAADSDAARDYYAETITRLGGRESTNGAWFIAEVERAYNAAKSIRPLTYRERRILAFANRRFQNVGQREQAIRDEFGPGYSATRYFQALNALIDRPEALRAYPELVERLRRQRAQRQAQRSARTETAGSAA